MDQGLVCRAARVGVRLKSKAAVDLGVGRDERGFMRERRRRLRVMMCLWEKAVP